MGLLNVLPYFTSPNIEIGYISQRWIVQLIKHRRCHRIIFFFFDETNILRYIYYYTYYSKAKGAFTLIYGLFCFVLFFSSPGYSAFLRFGWAVFKIEGKIKEDKSEGILNIGILRNPKKPLWKYCWSPLEVPSWQYPYYSHWLICVCVTLNLSRFSCLRNWSQLLLVQMYYCFFQLEKSPVIASVRNKFLLVPFAHLVEKRRKEIITEIHIQSI